MTRRKVARGAARKPTRHDVAVMAGVSDPVVTYTLTGRAPVAPDTAERVRAAIETLGYRPNHAARVLKSGSTGVIGLIAPRGEEPAFTSPFFTELALVAEERARARGFAFYMASYAVGTETIVDRLQELADRQVDGALVLPAEDHDVAAADAVGIPWVQVDTPKAIPGVRTIGADLYRGGVEAVTHLAEHGHRRIGYVGHLGNEPRYRAWRDTCRRHRLEPGPACFSLFSRAGGYATTREILATADLPPALFAASDPIGLGVLRALHEAGAAVPDECAVVSFDGSWEADYAWPTLTSVRQPVEEMAEAALSRLLDPLSGPEHTVFPVRLEVRASCGAH